MAQKYVMGNGANFYAQNGSTNFQVINSTGAVSFGALYKGNSTNSTDMVCSASGLLYSLGVPTNYAETITLTSVGLSVSTAPPYGVTYINPNSTGGDFTTSVRLLTLGRPIPGVEKTIIFATTAAAINTLDVSVTSDCGIISSSASTNLILAFSSLATLPQAVTMIGVSTSVWAITGIESTFIGLGEDVDCIRVLNAARTSG
jgi:hypothetical protein